MWETLVGVDAVHQWARPTRLADVRTIFGDSWKLVRRHVEGDHSGLVDLHTPSLRTAAAIALERERAISFAVGRQHARMAASLLQVGLFDRRIEREAAAQRELLEQALSRCHARIEELQRKQVASIITTRPAFALISW